MNLAQRILNIKDRAEAKHIETVGLITSYLNNIDKEKERFIEQLETQLENREPFRCSLYDNSFGFYYTIDMSPETEKVLAAYPYLHNEVVEHIRGGINHFLRNKYPLLCKLGGPSFYITKNIGYITFNVDIPKGGNTDNYYGLLSELNLPNALKVTICKERVKAYALEKQRAKEEETLRDDLELFSFKCKEVLPDILSRYLARNHKLTYEHESCLKVAEMKTVDLEDILQLDLVYESRRIESKVRNRYLETLAHDIATILEDLKLDMPGFELKAVPCYGGDTKVIIFFDIKK